MTATPIQTLAAQHFGSTPVGTAVPVLMPSGMNPGDLIFANFYGYRASGTAITGLANPGSWRWFDGLALFGSLPHGASIDGGRYILVQGYGRINPNCAFNGSIVNFTTTTGDLDELIVIVTHWRGIGNLSINTSQDGLSRDSDNVGSTVVTNRGTNNVIGEPSINIIVIEDAAAIITPVIRPYTVVVTEHGTNISGVLAYKIAPITETAADSTYSLGSSARWRSGMGAWKISAYTPGDPCPPPRGIWSIE